MTSSSNKPLSGLRGPPPAGRDPNWLRTFIGRMQAQPGGFRALKQSDVEVRIAAKNRKTEQNAEIQDAEKDAEEQDVEMGEEQRDQAQAPDALDMKDVLVKRDELFVHADHAYQHAMILLDLMSLLLSKENPSQAGQSLSPHLRQAVGIGTLGATLLERPTKLAQERAAEFKEMRIGRRLLDLRKAAATLSAAGGRFQQEMAREEKYWDEVRQVGDRGWSVFRMAERPGTMGVKFGFSRAAWSEAKLNSVAPLGRANDGTVILECGELAASSKRVRVVMLQNQQIVGYSSLPPPLPGHASLDERVKEARDSIFAQELWHELTREARTMYVYGVVLEEHAIVYHFEQRTIRLELVDLEDAHNDMLQSLGISAQENENAELVGTALHILLCHARDRQSNRHSGSLQANSSARGIPPPFKLFGPVFTFLKHEESMRECARFFSDLVAVSHMAGVTSASCKMTDLPLANSTSPMTEALMKALLLPTVARFDLDITPKARVRVQANPSSTYGTEYLITLLPPRGPETADGTNGELTVADNPLSDLHAPLSQEGMSPAWASFGITDPHYNFSDMMAYVQGGVSRALAAHCLDLIHAARGQNPSMWTLHYDNQSIRDVDTNELGVFFDVITNADKQSELRARACFKAKGGKLAVTAWAWTAHGGNQQGRLYDLVLQTTSAGSDLALQTTSAGSDLVLQIKSAGSAVGDRPL